MAGFTSNDVVGGEYEFHVDTPNVAERIRQAANGRRIITLQLDGDELEAALWGLENYRQRPVPCTHLSKCAGGVHPASWDR